MVRFTHPENKRGPGSLGPDGIPEGSRFSDMASYVTDTSSITNPAELMGPSYSGITEDGEDEESNAGDASHASFVSNATSALTGLTGWTSANGGGGAMTEASEQGESENFPLAHSKSYKSTFTAITEGDEQTEAYSEMQSQGMSAISFDMDGSVETSMGEIEVPSLAPARTRSYKSKGSRGSRSKGQQGNNHNGRPPLSVLPPGKAVQFRSPSHVSSSEKSPKPAQLKLKSKGSGYGASSNSSILSSNSQGSKGSRSQKRAPVPQMRDPNMDDTEQDQIWEEDCNYDINPTIMFSVLESHDWEEALKLLDGKGLENKDEAWNLGSFFGGKAKEVDAASIEITKKRQKELKQQARTWIVRRERNGVLRWRMLPLHAALAFNAPFDIVVRLYHLYPGAVRCRNDLGMLALHHVFKFGNEDKILELLMDVFPEALTVKDDKGRLPLECTPKDGSENERRTNILTLFGNFRVELSKKDTKKSQDAIESTLAESLKKDAIAKLVATPGTPDSKKSQHSSFSAPAALAMTRTPTPATTYSTSPEGTLGAVPRYGSNNGNMGYNTVTYNSIKPLTVQTTAPEKKAVEQDQPTKEAAPTTPLSPKEDDASDRYALFNSEDSENNSSFGNAGKLGGLSPIREEDEDGEPSLARKALKSELLALQEKKKKKGIRRLFGKKKALTQI